MAETGKSEPGEIPDEQVRKILEDAAKKTPPAERGTPLLTGEAADAVKINIKKKGEVWKKKSEKKKSK